MQCSRHWSSRDSQELQSAARQQSAQRGSVSRSLPSAAVPVYAGSQGVSVKRQRWRTCNLITHWLCGWRREDCNPLYRIRITQVRPCQHLTVLAGPVASHPAEP